MIGKQMARATLSRLSVGLLAGLFFGLCFAPPFPAREGLFAAEPDPAPEAEKQEDLREEIKRLKQRMKDLEEQRIADEEEGEKKSLKISGYLDSSAVYIQPGGTLGGTLRSNGGFEQSGVHLYMDGNYRKTFRAFAELVFLPTGQFSVYKDIYTDPATGQPVVASRPLPKYGIGADVDPRSPATLHVDRAFFDYTPSDAFKVRLGKFLTPYGIWNLDHGPLVITSIRLPMINYDTNSLGTLMVPNYQTGLEFFGNLELLKVQVSYAIYAANSNNETPDLPQVTTVRNPLAGGGYLNLDFRDWLHVVRVELGGSYYKGTDRQTIDTTNAIIASAYDTGYDFRAYMPSLQTTQTDLMLMAMHGDTAALTAFYQSLLAMGSLNRRINLYDVENRVGAGHAKISIGDFQFQTEYMYDWVKVNDPGVRSMNRTQSAFGLDPFNENLYDHDYNRESWYASIQYRIAGRVTPYYRYEKVTPSTLARDFYANVNVVGLSYRPEPFLALKFEFFQLQPTDNRPNLPVLLQEATAYRLNYFRCQVSIAF